MDRGRGKGGRSAGRQKGKGGGGLNAGRRTSWHALSVLQWLLDLVGPSVVSRVPISNVSRSVASAFVLPLHASPSPKINIFGG